MDVMKVCSVYCAVLSYAQLARNVGIIVEEKVFIRDMIYVRTTMLNKTSYV